MVQTSNPQPANFSMKEYSPFSGGTFRSKLVRDDVDDPCTRNSTGSAADPAFGALMRLRNMFSFTAPFCAQYSLLHIFPFSAAGPQEFCADGSASAFAGKPSVANPPAAMGALCKNDRRENSFFTLIFASVKFRQQKV